MVQDSNENKEFRVSLYPKNGVKIAGRGSLIGRWGVSILRPYINHMVLLKTVFGIGLNPGITGAFKLLHYASSIENMAFTCLLFGAEVEVHNIPSTTYMGL